MIKVVQIVLLRYMEKHTNLYSLLSSMNAVKLYLKKLLNWFDEAELLKFDVDDCENSVDVRMDFSPVFMDQKSFGSLDSYVNMSFQKNEDSFILLSCPQLVTRDTFSDFELYGSLIAKRTSVGFGNDSVSDRARLYFDTKDRFYKIISAD